MHIEYQVIRANFLFEYFCNLEKKTGSGSIWSHVLNLIFALKLCSSIKCLNVQNTFDLLVLCVSHFLLV
jgi:hypothetical protein